LIIRIDPNGLLSGLEQFVNQLRMKGQTFWEGTADVIGTHDIVTIIEFSLRK
jgi:hypothetical protein